LWRVAFQRHTNHPTKSLGSTILHELSIVGPVNCTEREKFALPEAELRQIFIAHRDGSVGDYKSPGTPEGSRPEPVRNDRGWARGSDGR
jgi:hypothetical protein